MRALAIALAVLAAAALALAAMPHAPLYCKSIAIAKGGYTAVVDPVCWAPPPPPHKPPIIIPLMH